MKKEDKWIQDMRKSLEDYSEPLPSRLWEELEEELSAPKIIPIWRKRQVAAAVLALAVVSSLTVWFWHSSPAKYVQQASVAQKDVLNADVPQETSPAEEATVPSDRRELTTLPKPVSSPAVFSSQPASATFAVSSHNAVNHADEKRETKERTSLSSEADSDRTQQDKKLQQQQRDADRKQMQQNRYLANIAPRSSSKHNWSIGVAAGNTPYSTSSSFGGFSRLDSRSLSVPTNQAEAAYSQILLNNREQTTQTDIHHRMPVTIGASVKWNINEDWALESGITYTLLSSELHSGSNSYVEEEQRLHYIGIPLKVHRSIWQNKRFNFYASAGGMVEKCVSGKMETIYAYGIGKNETETSTLKISPLQWSVAAAIGAQVNFTRQFGLYVEPGMAYYFDDGSSIETIRKQHPFNFNLQLGLRFSFSE